MEEQRLGQRIWGWTVEGRRAGTWVALSNGRSIGHKRIISCADLQPAAGSALQSGRAFGGRPTRAASVDPPAPPPRADDVLFTECGQAHSWEQHPDGTIRPANRSSSEVIGAI